MFNGKTVLVLAPHTDDGEFGCGATLAKAVGSGARCVYVAFSAAEQSVLPHLPRNILRTEVREATENLGIAPQDCIVLDYQVRCFHDHRQKILDDMIRINREICPDLVFLPSMNDTHQDHIVIAQEGFRAFKRVTMLGYEVPWNNLDFRTSCFVSVSKENLEKKISSISKYQSQAQRSYARADYLEALAITRGVQIGQQYAECFEVVRWVI